MKQILEKCYEFDVDIHMLFIDFKQAFDSINKKALLESLSRLGVPDKLINLIKATITNIKGRAMIQGTYSEEFEIQKGVKQGDSLSATLFNLALETAVRATSTNPGGTIFNSMIVSSICRRCCNYRTKHKYLKRGF